MQHRSKKLQEKDMMGVVDGKKIVVGNQKLMQQFNISTPIEIDVIVESIVLIWN